MLAGPIAQVLASNAVTSTHEQHHQTLGIYPNPAHDVLYVQGLPLTDGNAIRISEAQGRVVQEATTHDDRLHIATLVPGLYFLTVDATYSTRFIKL